MTQIAIGAEDKNQRILLTQPEATAYLGLNIKLFRKEVDAGNIKYILIGQRKRFTQADLDAFINERRTVSCPSINQRVRRTGTSISRSRVIGFTARLEQEAKKTPKTSRPSTDAAQPQR